MSMNRKRDDLTRFYEEVGAKYPEEEIVYRDLRGKLRRKFVLSYLHDTGGAFLDLGCNAGGYIKQFAGEKAVGVDLSPSALQKARRRCKAQSRRYFIAGNIENLRFLQNIQFDFILCSEVLEHLFHPEKVFAGIFRLLKPGGTALITTPNYKKKKPTWIPLGELKHSVAGDLYYHTAYRPEELAEMAGKAKLTVLKKGTLEWEVKYAAKIPALFFVTFRFLNRSLFRNQKLDKMNQRNFERFTLFFYKAGHLTGLEKLFRFVIHEGTRSFILLTK